MRFYIIVFTGFFSVLFTSSAAAIQIQACVNNGSGALRIVSGPGECRSAEMPIQWNTEGPAGPAGPPGPPGPMGEPGSGTDLGQVVRIDLPATSGFDKTWFVPLGKALLVDHIAWSNGWGTLDPMNVNIRHFINKSGGVTETTLTTTTGFMSFDRPLVLPANTGLEAPGLGDSTQFPREVFVYGRLVDAESALLSGVNN